MTPRDEKPFFEMAALGPRMIGTGAFFVSLGLAIFWSHPASATTTDFAIHALAYASAASGLALIGRGARSKLKPTPRVTLSELGILDARGFGGPIPWSAIASTSRKTVNGQEMMVIDLKDEPAYLAKLSLWQRLRRALERRAGFPLFYIGAAPWTKHDFNHIVSFSLLYHQRYA